MPGLGARLNDIHTLLLGGSRTASLRLFREAEGPLTGYLLRSLLVRTSEEARDIAIDAIAGYLENPQSFDPTKSSLWSYLCMVAGANARDSLRQKLNRKELLEENSYEIELWGAQANNWYDDVEWRRDAEKIMALHGNVIAQDDRERQVLKLMLDGERSVAAYAEALGLDSASDIAAEVKRVKDRITLRIKKVGDELG
jgi:RNA polymerase sigma factor (sigma-70 family)